MLLLSHLVKAAVRGFFRIAFTSLFFIALGVGASLAVAYQVTQVWPPTTPTYIIAGAIGALLGYAAGLTALVRETIRGVRTAERDVVEGVEQAEERVTRA
jgi:xanthosine utilization system XapX-like protein